ncbi:unnamed protein product [Paramecium sonneborni]|uniref:Uncharacterized protein n=1 Tax=Paramecium sonneborni TaxID=65129 RepID=A0A8S1M0Q2_9CILI|nr:unnamed protein product [Paramecium sonneborni]
MKLKSCLLSKSAAQIKAQDNVYRNQFILQNVKTINDFHFGMVNLKEMSDRHENISRSLQGQKIIQKMITRIIKIQRGSGVQSLKIDPYEEQTRTQRDF